MNKKFWISAFGILFFCLLASLTFFDFGLKYNASESLPYHLFISMPLKRLEKGKIVTFLHPKLKSSIGKIVMGLPGEKIEVKNSRVFVEGIDCGFIKPVSQSGKKYHPVREGLIPKGFVYVSATHPESFDSRYVEFGLIDQKWITGELWPLF